MDPPSLCNVHETSPTSEALTHVLPRLARHLSLSDLLNFRLVSKAISGTVDQQLESNYSVCPPNKNNSLSDYVQLSPFLSCRIHSSPTGPNILEGIHLLDTPTIQKFLIHMNNHSKNPFIGQFVRFGNYSDTSNNTEYWGNVKTLLKKFGRHILHVELSDGHAPLDILSCYKIIRECLLLLPNLKSLELAFAHSKVYEEEIAGLDRFMKYNPLPALYFLEKLEWNEHRVCESFQNFVIATYSNQLQALAAPMSVFYVEITESTFSNLAVLYLTNVENNEYLVDMKWCKLPALKKLYLNLGGERCTSCGDISTEVWNMKSVLQLVKHYRLELLSLFVAPGGVFTGCRTISTKEWTLDCLKVLEIQHCKENSYEFLRCFPNLEHIHFFDIHHPVFPERRKSTCGSEEMGRGGTNAKLEVEKLIYQGRMYESNVWEAIPSLKVLTFKCVWDREGKNLIALNDWYLRETYEHRKKPKPGISENANENIATEEAVSSGVISRVVGFMKSMFSVSP